MSRQGLMCRRRYGGPAYYGSYGGYYSNSVSIVSSPAYNYVEK